MKIVVDDKIPYIREAIGRITGDAVYLKGSEIGPEDVKDADALIVRTRTLCDERLLKGSKVQFVATATIGYDHLDTEFLEREGIEWMNCPGCNAGSVAQYVRSVLILLRGLGELGGLRVLGIVGCGNVGTKIKAVAEEMGFRALVCDPPRHDRGESGFGATLDEIAEQCDIITFHTPLTKDGKYATYHLADSAFFKKLKRKPVIINTSRGSVVDNDALVDALENGIVREAIIDTWENEPQINKKLLYLSYIGTPHIAGYSADGKVNASNMVLKGLCRHFGIECPEKIEPPKAENATLNHEFGTDEYYLSLYNPLEDSARLKSNPEAFEDLRGDYPVRREKI